MTFLTPLMLLGAAAAGIPVAIHLFFRSRYRTVPWAAMKFLLTSVEQTSRRLKFQEYALLLLRMTVLVLLAIAFMRPVNLTYTSCLWILTAVVLFNVTLTWWLVIWPAPSALNYVIRFVASYALIVLVWIFVFGLYWLGATGAGTMARGRGDMVDAVFVFDLSYSMAAQDGEKTRLQRAKDEAVKIIDELPPHSTVQIVSCTEKSFSNLGPQSPGNLDQAKKLVQSLEIAHRASDLSTGVIEAKGILDRGLASSKELYIFSDMQRLGFDQEAEKLKGTLTEIREKAVVHLVRCGTRNPKNVAIVGITPQTGIPRPGERVGFAVLVRNTGRDPAANLTVSLNVEGEKTPPEKAFIKSLPPGETRAVTIDGKLESAGLRVLTAKVIQDDLDADNRFDHVIQVREQVNILVVDGNYYERDPEKSSSFFLMHALLPVREAERATYKYNPRVVPARLAARRLLDNQDLVILVNCALQGDAFLNFIEALGPFVRKGKGLVIFSGDNVRPDAYNAILGKKAGLLPMPIKDAIKAEKKPFLVNRTSFGAGPPGYWIFKDEKYYEEFNKVEVWKHMELDESAVKARDKEKVEPKQEDEQADPDKKPAEEKNDSPVSVVVRLNTGKPLVASRAVGSGQVVFVATAAHHEGLDSKTFIPSWTDIGTAPEFIPFMDVTVNHLVNGQAQTYNVTAGNTLAWYPTEKIDYVYNLVNPEGRVTRLGQPERIKRRYAVVANDLPRAGVYRMTAHRFGMESIGETIDPVEAAKVGTPIAVAPDLRESADLSSYTEAEIDGKLGFAPIHLIAGDDGVSTGSDRTNREWTTWALLAVMALVLIEIAFAWWCGRGW